MGIGAAMDQLSNAVVNVIPLQHPNQPFRAIDMNGAAPRLEEIAKTTDRSFDIGTLSLPEDDGEAGSPDCGRLRARVELVLRIGYRLGDNLNRRALDVMIAEDIRRVVNCIMSPMNWDAANTDILTVMPPRTPVADNIDDQALIINIPFTMLYRELVP